MEGLTILLALVVLVVAALAVAVAMKGRDVAGPAPDLLARLDHQDRLLQEIKAKSELGDKGQDLIREELSRASRTLSALQVDLEARRRLEEENRAMVKRLEGVIVGSYAKGRAGENILRETFKLFPQGMVEMDFQVGGKVVEFALKLFDGKVLPIDSKWPSTPLLMALDDEKDESKRASLISEIEKEVGRRVKEVGGYIDIAKTVPWAVAAVPDSIFSVCKRAFLEAYRCRVILMSYSMAIPYILTFYSLHLQYSRSVDVGNMQAHLIDIDRHLDEVDLTLENRVAKGSTMIANAYADLRQAIGKIRGSLSYLQVLETSADMAEVTGEPAEPIAAGEVVAGVPKAPEAPHKPGS